MMGLSQLHRGQSNALSPLSPLLLPIWISAVLQQQLKHGMLELGCFKLKPKSLQLKNQPVRDGSAKFAELLVTEITHKAQGSLDASTG